MERTSNYRPQKNGFPFKLLKYLNENGVSSGIAAQEGIGLNAWADAKGPMYHDRASSNFDGIVMQLHQRGLITIMDNDHYDLTKLGKEFIANYNVR